MKRATVANGENRSVELEVADVLLQLQHKDDPSTDAPTEQGPQGGRVVDQGDHSFVPTATPLHRAASRSLARSDHSTQLPSTTTTTTTTSSTAYSEPRQMQQTSTASPLRTCSSVPRRLGIEFLLNDPPAPSSSSSSASPPSPSSSSASSFDHHHQASCPWPYIGEQTNTKSRGGGGATRAADLQKLEVAGHYLTKSDRNYIVIEEEEEEEDQNDDYALRSPREEGETATQTDRCLSSSDEDCDEAGSSSSSLPEVLVGYGLASVATTATRAGAATTTSPRRRPLGGDDRRPPDSTARKFLNEKLRQRLEEKRRHSAAQTTKATSSSPAAEQEAHAGRRSKCEAGGAEEQVGRGSRGSSRAGANLSTPGGRRGVATKKELDIWEQLMLTSVIQPLLPSSSHSRPHSPPTLSSSLPLSTLTSSSSSSSSPRGRHQQQPEAPVACMCALGPPPGLAAYPYISYGHGHGHGHNHNHSHSSVLPHWGGPPPLASDLHQSADVFVDDDDNRDWYRAAEGRKRKREHKNERDDDDGYNYAAYPRHLARSVPAYQSQAYDDHHRQSRRPRLDPTDHQTTQALMHHHEAGCRRDLSPPRRPRDSSALVFHHHTGAPVLDARIRPPGGTHSRSLVDVDLRGH